MASTISPPLPIYLDHNATTPVDDRVLAAMLPYFSQVFGNAASLSHSFGTDAADAVERAREQVAQLIGADPREVVWTSGATESNNLAVIGAANMYAREWGRGNHIITSRTEHSAVLDPCRHLEKQGIQVTYIKPNPGSGGVITADQVEQAIRDDTILVSIMWANNETGTISDVPSIGRLCKAHDVIFHTDATQFVGKLPVDVNEAGIDLLSCSGHKIYGPKGVGVLYARRRGPRVRLVPIIHGGGHERGMRSGTLNVPGIVGFGKACEVCMDDMQSEAIRVAKLRDHLESGIMDQLDDVEINGDRERRIPTTSNMGFGGVSGERLLGELTDLAVSIGAACTSAKSKPSHVLRNIGVREDLQQSSVRFSLGRSTTESQIEYAIEHVVTAVKRLRSMGPVAAVACELDADAV